MPICVLLYILTDGGMVLTISMYNMSVCVYVCVMVCMYVCVCECVKEKERESTESTKNITVFVSVVYMHSVHILYVHVYRNKH